MAEYWVNDVAVEPLTMPYARNVLVQYVLHTSSGMHSKLVTLSSSQTIRRLSNGSLFSAMHDAKGWRQYLQKFSTAQSLWDSWWQRSKPD
jgi:hypothetical protein